MSKYPKMSDAAKLRIANMKRNESGQFSSSPSDSMVPPTSRVNYKSNFIANPAPINDIVWNPDIAYSSNQTNAALMISDMTIYSALQERMTASSTLPWSIIPQDEDEAEQQEAADCIEDIVRSYLPDMPDFLLNLNWASYYGRQGCYLDYQWKFKNKRKLMVPTSWTGVNGDSLVFGVNGELGYRVGLGFERANEVKTSVEGRYLPVESDEEREFDEDTKKYLTPVQRKAWIVHHFNRSAGEFNLWRSAGSKYGVGLRSRLYPIWVLKQSILEFIIQNAERFGAGWVIGYFQAGNQASADAVKEALQKQQGSCTMMFPRYAPGEDAVEGVEVVNPPNGLENLLKTVEYFDKQVRLVITGEELTASAKSTGMGSNTSKVQESTFERLVSYDSSILAETISKDFIAVLQEFNGYGHLPPLKFEFSRDIGTAEEKLNRAKILFDMGVSISKTELLQAAGFSAPKDSEDQTISPTPSEDTGEIKHKLLPIDVNQEDHSDFRELKNS